MPNPRHAIRSGNHKDSVLLLPESRVCYAGDLLFIGIAPVMWRLGDFGDGRSPFLWHKKPWIFLGFQSSFGWVFISIFWVETSWNFQIFRIFFIPSCSSNIQTAAWFLEDPGMLGWSLGITQGWACCCLGESFGRSAGGSLCRSVHWMRWEFPGWHWWILKLM